MEFPLTYTISEGNVKQTNQSRHYEPELKEQVGSVGIIPSTFTCTRVCKDEHLIIPTRSTTLILESSFLRAKRRCFKECVKHSKTQCLTLTGKEVTPKF